MRHSTIFGIIGAIAILALGYLLVNASKSPSQETTPQTKRIEENPTITTNKETPMTAIIHTTKGDIEIEFFGDLAPNTVKNFTKLSSEGFYNDVKFHRVIEGFMIQGGDPLTKDETAQARWGTGGPGYMFADEIHKENKNDRGTISMANAGANTNGSQFFINLADNNFLDAKHTVFGRVVGGMEVVDAIGTTRVDGSDRPIDAISITSIDLK